MVSPFETVINNLNNLGAFQFLFPFMLTAAIFYGLLRRSKLFGDPQSNVAINAIVSIVAAFMVWAYPVIAGVNIQATLSTFFLQATMATLVVIVGIMIGGMFLPEDFASNLGSKIGGKGIIAFVITGLLIAAGIFISSGLVNLLIPGGLSTGGIGGLSQDDITTIVILTILVLSVAAIVVVPGGKS